MKLKTKYGDINIIETDDGAVEVRFDTMDNVLVEMNSTNNITFHVLTPMTNIIKTKKNFKEPKEPKFIQKPDAIFNCRNLKIRELKESPLKDGIKRYYVVNGDYTIFAKDMIIVGIRTGACYNLDPDLVSCLFDDLIGVRLVNMGVRDDDTKDIQEI